MEKTREDANAIAAKKEKKSKKNKTNKTGDLLYDDAGEGVLDVGDDLSKEKGHKHRDKKRKSNENENDKGDLVNDGGSQKTQKKEKKRKRDSSENKAGQDNEAAEEIDCDPKGTLISKEGCQEDVFDKTDKKKKKKKKTDTEMNTTVNEVTRVKKPGVSTQMDKTSEDADASATKKGKKLKKNKTKTDDLEIGGDHSKEKGRKHREKKRKSNENENGNEDENDKGDLVNDGDSQKTEKKKPKGKGKSKKVSFAGQVEVFSETKKQPTKGDDLVRGKRFTPEEDEIVKQAVFDYITAHGLGDDGLKMVLNCNNYPGMRKCWQEIGTCIPYRPYPAVYSRAHILFERSENRSWSPQEVESLKEFQNKYGNDWRKIADELGKHRLHVKDKWRKIKPENLKAGHWSQDEYQSFYELVNMDLQMKVNSERKSKHGMLRDNIPWTAISEKLTTRNDTTCCRKWYQQLTSSLVVEEKWSDADDYRMIGALYEIDAACVEDVDWDNLLEHRPGDICRKRWEQMVKHIDHGSKTFGEQVDILAKRYSPDLAETRQAWDNKPLVP